MPPTRSSSPASMPAVTRPGPRRAHRSTAVRPRRVTVQFFLAGAAGATSPACHRQGLGQVHVRQARQQAAAPPTGRPRARGSPVSGSARPGRAATTSRTSVERRRLDYAPFILRPKQISTAPVLVIEPTNTWHAYDIYDGDSWYLYPTVHVIDLTHPFAAADGGAAVPAGLPEQFWRLDIGFLAGTGGAAIAPTSSPTTISRTSRTSSSSSATGSSSSPGTRST